MAMPLPDATVHSPGPQARSFWQPQRGAERAAWAWVFVLFAYVLLANSWVSDDARITFRVSDNLIHGFGPRWNVAERVQAFTNPLWMIVMAGAAAVTGEFYYTSLLVSFRR